MKRRDIVAKKTYKCKVCKKNIRQKAGPGRARRTHAGCAKKKKTPVRRAKKKKTSRKKTKKKTTKKKTRGKKVDISRYKKFKCIWCDKSKTVAQIHDNLGLLKKKLIGICKRCGPDSDKTRKLMRSAGSLTMFGTKIYKRWKRG